MENDIDNPVPCVAPDGADEDDIKVVAHLNTLMYVTASMHQVCELRADALTRENKIKRVLGWNKTRAMRKDVKNHWERYIMMRNSVMKHIIEKVECD